MMNLYTPKMIRMSAKEMDSRKFKHAAAARALCNLEYARTVSGMIE